MRTDADQLKESAQKEEELTEEQKRKIQF